MFVIRVDSVVCNEGKRIKCKWLICNPDYLQEDISQTKKRGSISRAIVITSGSLSKSDREEVGEGILYLALLFK